MLDSPDFATSDKLWALTEEALSGLCKAWTDGRFVPVLEADTAGYFYYVLVARCSGDASWLHLSTRFHCANEKEKYDLVAGPVLTTDTLKTTFLEKAADRLGPDLKKFVASKSTLQLFRPAVDARLVLEFKVFARGFTPQQLREHHTQALGDIAKLRKLAEIYPRVRGVAILDDYGYLDRTREKALADERGDDRALRISLCRRDSSGVAFWSLMPSAAD